VGFEGVGVIGFRDKVKRNKSDKKMFDQLLMDEICEFPEQR